MLEILFLVKSIYKIFLKSCWKKSWLRLSFYLLLHFYISFSLTILIIQNLFSDICFFIIDKADY